MPSMRLATYLPGGRTSLRLAIDVASILFPMQSLIEIPRTQLLGLFSTVLYPEFLRLLNIE